MLKTTLKILFSSALLVATPAAFASSYAWPLYTFGNGDIIAAVLNGLQALVGSNVFSTMMIIFILFGFFWLMVLSMQRGRLAFEGTVKYVIFTTILVRLLLSWNVNVGLIDTVNPANDIVVTTIPAVIAVPASILSNFGHTISALLDEAYSSSSASSHRPPLQLTMTGGTAQGAQGAPYSFIAQMVKDGATYHIQDPYLKASITHFIVDCVTPMIGNGALNTNQLMTSNNLWQLIGSSKVNPAIMTTYYGMEGGSYSNIMGKIQTCQESYGLISSDLKRAKQQGTFIKNWESDVTTAASASLFKTVLNYTARNSTYSPTPGDYLLQAAMLNVLKGPAATLMASQTSSTTLMTRVAVSEAVSSAVKSWSTKSSVWQATFGYIYAALQVLVYAAAPMILLFALIPGLRGRMLKRYIQLLAWFPVTLILLSIVNDAFAFKTQQVLHEVWTAHGGLTLIGQAFISARASKMMLIGGWLITVVPLLAWSIVAGGTFAMSELLFATGASTFGSRAAEQAATGNQSLDNQSYDNLTANKFGSAMQTDMGALPSTFHEAGTNPLEADNLGGIGVMRNAATDMSNITSTMTTTSDFSANDSLKSGSSHSFAENSRLAQTARTSAQEVNQVASSLNASAKSGVIAAAASTGMQAYLSHHNYEGVDKTAVNEASQDIQSATVASANAAKADAANDHQAAEGWMEKSKDSIEHAYDTLEKHGVMGKVAAGGLVVAGLAAAAATLPEDAAVAAGGAVVAGAEEGVSAIGGYTGAAFAEGSEASGLTSAEIGSAGDEAALGGEAAAAETSEAESEASSALENMGKGAATSAGAESAWGRAFSAANRNITGSAGLSTTDSRGNTVETGVTGVQDQSETDQSSYGEDSQFGSRTSISGVTQETSTHAAPNTDYYAAHGGGSLSGNSINTPLKEASASIQGRMSNVGQVSGATQDKIDALRSRVKSTIRTNIKAVQGKGVPDFIASKAAHQAYKEQF